MSTAGQTRRRRCRRRAGPAQVQGSIDEIVAGSLPPSANAGAWLRAHPTVDDYLDVRTEMLAELYADLAAASSPDLGYYFGLLDPGRTWMYGVDGHALAYHLEYYLVPAYEPSREAVLDP